MSRHREQLHVRAVPTTADAVRGTSTKAATTPRPRAAEESLGMFGDVSPHVLMQMELIVRASSTPAAALAPVIALLVDGPAPKRAAIVDAFSTNDPLREQWEQAWAALRR